jgi:hypothetical protein
MGKLEKQMDQVIHMLENISAATCGGGDGQGPAGAHGAPRHFGTFDRTNSSKHVTGRAGARGAPSPVKKHTKKKQIVTVTD